MYRGIFGSHVANILRRLFRLCYVYGSSPQVVCCSASIQNPRQHFSWLVPHQSLQPAARTPSDDPSPNTNASPEVTVIEQDKDGSPCGTKHFVVWRPTPPPVTSFDPNEPHNPDLTGSTIFQSAQILATLVAAKVPTIAFCRGRKLTELVVEYTHNVLRRQNQSHLIPRVKGYRGGYSVESRRAIEAQLFRHELLGVVATNALELGIDIGSLECTLHLGYPPSIASMWQQAGRAGRSGHDSMAVIVCFDSPLDAYNTSLGSAMFAKPPEPVVLDPTNLFVVKQHLQCASLEMDLLSPRSGTLDIDRVDTAAKIVLAKQSPSRLKYYTCCRDFTDIDISTTFLPSVAYSSHVHLGIAHATTYVVGCYSLEKRTQKILNRTDFSLPPMEADGHAVWMDIPIHVGGPSKGMRDPIRDALHGAASGFKLSILLKLVQVKAADNSMTLLNYLAKILREKEATWLTFIDAIPSIQEASRVTHQVLKAGEAAIRKAADLAVQELDVHKKLPNIADNDKFQDAISPIRREAETKKRMDMLASSKQQQKQQKGLEFSSLKAGDAQDIVKKIRGKRSEEKRKELADHEHASNQNSDSFCSSSSGIDKKKARVPPSIPEAHGDVA
ncbi:hypothetical protein B5M09_011903 [Aphanomyces astaci]|uniref:Helicase C-terminal domain-containing protein n=1 Tax=Aphanomyces astaci TaxID=112090 RepID=A0A3R7WS29_APHAT|nr:hypothetical protein B5M09_011903 [Aphanomyces astaci]